MTVNKKEVSDNIKELLKTMASDYEAADRFIHEQISSVCHRNEQYFHGLQNLFWDETAGDWATPGQEDLDFIADENVGTNEGFPLYDYVINFFKAHGESIISALSAQIPGVHFPPDDVDSPDDYSTARAFDNIAVLIQKHNKVKLLFIRFLYLLWNQGLVAVYTYTKADEKFGTVDIPKYKKEKIKDPDLHFCSTCLNPTNPPSEEGTSLCENCNKETDVTTQEGKDREIPVPDGTETTPKTRVFMEGYGPLNVRIPYYAKNQAQCHYLKFSIEVHFSILRMEFPEIEDKIHAGMGAKGSYQRWARAPNTFATAWKGDENPEYITKTMLWLRPSAYYRLDKKVYGKERDELKRKFPKGIVVTFVGSEVAEVKEADLDEDWTISESPFSEYIHADPLGLPLISLQDMKNTVWNLTVDTIEHGVPDSFYDPKVMDPNVYKNHESQPGLKYPVKSAIPGQPLAQSFHQEQTATLSKEVQVFDNQIDVTSQFLVGDVPSIYGGPGEGNSRTFSEYNMSRAMALQRLNGNPWSFVEDLWLRVMDKAVRKFAKAMISDERFPQKMNGNFLNIWIKKAELEGKVGEVEPEASNTFPVTTGQQRDILVKLLEGKIPELNAAIFHPENTKNVAEALSFPNFFIPGRDQLAKCYRDIYRLVKDASGDDFSPSMEEPSIPIDNDVDDHQLFIAVIKDYMAKNSILEDVNPMAYANLRAAMKAHEKVLEQQTMMQHQTTPVGVQPPSAHPQ